MQEDQNEKGSSAVVTAMSGAGLPVLQWKGSERIAELFRDAARAAHGKNVKLCSKPVKRKRIRWKAPDQPDLHQAFHRDFRFFEKRGNVCFRDQTLEEDSGYRGGDIHEDCVAFFDALSLLPENFPALGKGAEAVVRKLTSSQRQMSSRGTVPSSRTVIQFPPRI